jgi:hypothetical protein
MRQAEGYIFEIILFCPLNDEVLSRHPNILTLLGRLISAQSFDSLFRFMV